MKITEEILNKKVKRDPAVRDENLLHPYSPDCRLCFSGKAHSILEHDASLKRNYLASTPDEIAEDIFDTFEDNIQ